MAWSTVAALILAAFALASLRMGEKRQETPGPLSRSGVTSVILPADPGTPGTHVFVPGEQENMLVRVPSTVTITRTQLTQDFFLSEESH
ncbi:MAG: hypothetical protein HYX74_07155 [Acidobacteria bacterium]|nr:hypothetical protein [Acidobacteriota bacterium]